MNIAFITEGQFIGKVPRTHPNMRTDLAWMCALEADHIPIKDIKNVKEGIYDLGIFILPKNLELVVGYLDDINLHSKFKKVGFLQEGPQTYFQTYTLRLQFWFYNFVNDADFIFVHNEIDKLYFEGLYSRPVYLMPSLMIEDVLHDLKIKSYIDRENKTVIGGNFTEWYSGFDSFVIANQLTESRIVAPSMGRSSKDEDLVVTKLPYLQWNEWIKELNNYRYGVHLMRTYAAGTFALNCSYLGIPCIGYESLDTQRILHPLLTVKEGDIQKARELAIELKTNLTFYELVSSMTRERYIKTYTEKTFKENFYKNVNLLIS
jgi:hypothetical protein